MKMKKNKMKMKNKKKGVKVESRDTFRIQQGLPEENTQ